MNNTRTSSDLLTSSVLLTSSDLKSCSIAAPTPNVINCRYPFTKTTPPCQDANAINQEQVKNIIKNGSPNDGPLLLILCRNTILPIDVFRWIAQSRSCCPEFINTVILARVRLDNLVSRVVKFIKHEEEATKLYKPHLSVTEFCNMLYNNKELAFDKLESQYLIMLLTDKPWSVWSYETTSGIQEKFTVSNISKHHSRTEDLIHEALCNTAFLGDPNLFAMLIQAAVDNNIICEFKPESRKMDLIVHLRLVDIIENPRTLIKADQQKTAVVEPDEKRASCNMRDYSRALAHLTSIFLFQKTCKK